MSDKPLETQKQGNKETRKQGDKDGVAEPSSAPLTAEVQAYCVKCKTMRPMKEGRAIFMANGRPAAEGRCVECGTKLFKIGATADHAGLAKPEVATGGRGNNETRKKGEKETGKQGDKVTRRQRQGG